MYNAHYVQCTFNSIYDFFLGFSQRMKILYALDISRDIARNTFQKMKEFVKGSLHMFKISENTGTNVGLASFDSVTREILQINRGTSTDIIIDSLDNLKLGSSDRNLNQALRSISSSMFNLSPNVKRALVIVLNGQDSSSVYDNIREIAQSLIQKGVNIYVVAIGNDVNKKQLNALVDGNGINIKMVKDSADLPDAIPSYEEFLGRLIGIGSFILYISCYLKTLRLYNTNN